MELLEAALLGVLQGLGEFLPISSSGHLALLHALGLKTKDDATFDVALHLATLAAVIIVFAPEVVRMIQGLGMLAKSRYWKDPKGVSEHSYLNGRLTQFVIVGTIPTVILGFIGYYFLHHFHETQDPRIVGCFLIMTGCLLFVTRNVRVGSRGLFEMRSGDAVLVGTAQGFSAVCPGFSRSGSTISTGLLRGLDRKLAGRFSFLLAIPAILGAALLKAMEVRKTGMDLGLDVVVGMVFAFVVGYFSLRILLKVVEKGKLSGFAYYLWAVGLAAVIYGVLKG